MFYLSVYYHYLQQRSRMSVEFMTVFLVMTIHGGGCVCSMPTFAREVSIFTYLRLSIFLTHSVVVDKFELATRRHHQR